MRHKRSSYPYLCIQAKRTTNCRTKKNSNTLTFHWKIRIFFKPHICNSSGKPEFLTHFCVFISGMETSYTIWEIEHKTWSSKVSISYQFFFLKSFVDVRSHFECGEHASKKTLKMFQISRVRLVKPYFKRVIISKEKIAHTKPEACKPKASASSIKPWFGGAAATASVVIDE